MYWLKPYILLNYSHSYYKSLDLIKTLKLIYVYQSNKTRENSEKIITVFFSGI